jgi:predicted ribosomally synthesized peptide with SipW-like signal peptide
MAMSVVAFGLFQIWMYGFILTIFSHSFWWAYGFVLLIVHAFLWTADHAHDTPEMLFPLQVWWTFIYPFGAAGAAAFVHFFGTPKLIDISILHVDSATKRPRFGVLGMGTLAFVWGWIAVFAAINFLMLRFSDTGMSPFDPTWSDASSNLAGGLCAAAAAILTLGSTWALWTDSDPDNANASRRNIKYLWILGVIIWTGYVHDVLSEMEATWPPGGIMLAVFFGLTIIIAPQLAIRVPGYVSKNGNLDPFTGRGNRVSNAYKFFGAIFATTAGALILSWVLNVLTDSNEVIIFVSLIGYTALLIVVIAVVSNYLAEHPSEPFYLLTRRTGEALLLESAAGD